MSRELENKARVTIDGKRYRMGNPNHPFHDLYQQHGPEAVYRKMGLLEDEYQPSNDGILKGVATAMTGLVIAIVGTVCIGVFLG